MRTERVGNTVALPLPNVNGNLRTISKLGMFDTRRAHQPNRRPSLRIRRLNWSNAPASGPTRSTVIGIGENRLF